MHDGLSDKLDEWLAVDDSEDENPESVAGTLYASPDRALQARQMAMDHLTQGSDWSDALVLDQRRQCR